MSQDGQIYVFGGWDGIFYAVDARGGMYWFRYFAGDGSNGPGAWANNGDAIHIGTGFDHGSCVERFAENGVVYAVWVNKDHNQPDRELRWYKLRNHTTVDRDGVVWINGNGALVGTASP